MYSNPISEPVQTDIREHYANSMVYNAGPMWNTTRQLLDEFYRPHTERLANLLKDKKCLWQ